MPGGSPGVCLALVLDLFHLFGISMEFNMMCGCQTFDHDIDYKKKDNE
ncbi:hypothetical protein A2U01_0046961, partial [Trifolium medium]|nr:hypothetical protein [Trifolium medium]